MATKPLDDEQEPLELTEEDQVEEPDNDAEQEDADEEEQSTEVNDEEETVIAFDGEEEDAPGDSTVIRRMRQELRDAKKRVSELERQSAKPKVEIGPKPTLEGCEYDEDRFEAELDAWKERKAQASQHEAQIEEQNRRANESWQRDVNAYAQRKATLGVSDYETSETAVSAALNEVQQAVIVKAAQDPAALIYALGKSDTKLAELAKYDDPIKLAAAIARMEGAVKVMKRKKAPELDRPQRGTGSTVQLSTDEQLAKLEKEAERTGNRTKVIAFKRKLREKEAK
jgi:hypothetical protein